MPAITQSSPAPSTQSTETATTVQPSSSPSKEYSIDDFLGDVAKPVEETPGAEDSGADGAEGDVAPEGDVPAEVEETPAEETPAEETPADPVQPAQKLPTRPYEKFPPEWRQDLRKMSSPAFSHFEKVYDENQTLKKALETKDKAIQESGNARWFTHDSAWLLNPEVTTVAQELRTLNDDLEYTKQQLLAIESSQPWTNRWKDANGQWQEQQLDPSPQGKMHLNGKYMDLRQEIAGKQAAYGQLKSGFQQSVKQYQNIIGKLDSSYFPNSNTDQWKAAVSKMFEGVPPYLQAMPEMNLLAKALITIDYLSKSRPKAQTAQNKVMAATNAALQSGKIRVNPGKPAGNKTTGTPGMNKFGVPLALEEATRDMEKQYGLA